MKTKQHSHPKLAEAIGIPELLLKREDQHKFGSHKGRSIPLMIKKYAKEGFTHFAISSSGNAALAAVLATERHNQNNPERLITLDIFVGMNIEENKLKRLSAVKKSEAVSIKQVERPKQEAFLLDKSGEAKYLRQSTDELALDGYLELGQDLMKIPNLQAVFVPTSSGTTAQALGELFAESDGPELHIVQTTSCHPMVEKESSDEESIAGAIVDKVAHRKDAVQAVVKKTNGDGWIVSNVEIKFAMQQIKNTENIQVSANGALGVAGLMQAVAYGKKFDGAVACIICGV
jgi:threonine dehydratase